jgi:hypothetical protein
MFVVGRIIIFINSLINLKLVEVQMEKTKKQSLIDRYGKVNIIIALLCVIFLIINSVIVSESVLNQLASNKYLAYVLNF